MRELTWTQKSSPWPGWLLVPLRQGRFVIFAGRRREESTREDSPLGQEQGGAWRREHKASTWPACSPSPGLSVLAEMQPGLLDQHRADLKSCAAQPQPSCSPPSCCSSIFPLQSCPPRCSVQFLGEWGLSLSPSVCFSSCPGNVCPCHIRPSQSAGHRARQM